jgi:hypothetical protein
VGTAASNRFIGGDTSIALGVVKSFPIGGFAACADGGAVLSAVEHVHAAGRFYQRGIFIGTEVGGHAAIDLA